jgi:hypothetical protein
MIFYRTPPGTEPVRDWLNSLPQEDRQSLGRDIAISNGVGRLECRSAGGGAATFRADGLPRVLFCTVQDCGVLLHGLIKKAQ